MICFLILLQSVSTFPVLGGPCVWPPVCGLICVLYNEQRNNHFTQDCASEAQAAGDGHFCCWGDAADSHSGVVSCLPGAPRASLSQLFASLCCCKDLIFLGKDEVQGGETLVE